MMSSLSEKVMLDSDLAELYGVPAKQPTTCFTRGLITICKRLMLNQGTCAHVDAA
jgi:hypothetical protein